MLILAAVLFSYNFRVMAKKHHITDSNSVGQAPQSRFVQICCAWGDKLANGILTYQINGGDSEARQAIYSAIANWNIKIDPLKLVDASNSNGDGGDGDNLVQPNIEVSIVSKSLKIFGSSHHRLASPFGQNARLTVGGLTQDTFDGNGFLTHAKITITTNALGKSFGSSNIEQIAEHEIGHALGLGHANFPGDLMFPIANFESHTISECDVSAVLESNHWKVAGSGITIPQTPHVNYMECR
jgi:hypothetical protein